MIPSTLVDSKEEEVLFFPSQDNRKKLEQVFRSAEFYIDVCVYIFSDTSLADTLIQVAKDKQVKIRVICDSQSGQYGGWNAINSLKNSENVQVKVFYSEPMKACLHNKFCIIDGQRFLLGSFNFTKKAYMNNFENIMIVNKKIGAIQKYQAEFDKLWKGIPLSSRTYWSSSNRIETQETQISSSQSKSMKEEANIEEVFDANSGNRPLKIADASPTQPSASSCRLLPVPDSLRQAHQPIPSTEACLGKRNSLQLDESCLEDFPQKRALFPPADISETSTTRTPSAVRPELVATSLAVYSFDFRKIVPHTEVESSMFSRLLQRMCVKKRQIDS